MGIAIANVIQAITEMTMLFITGMIEDVRVYSEARNKCFGHSVMTVNQQQRVQPQVAINPDLLLLHKQVYFFAIVVLLFQPLQVAETTGRSLDVLVTVCLSLLVDQVRVDWCLASSH